MAGTVAAVYGGLVRPRLLRWGASDEEVAGPYPGADIVPHGRRGATMACTIDARPEQVWPWLVQLGGDRAGWYSWTSWTTQDARVPTRSIPSGSTSRSAIT